MRRLRRSQSESGTTSCERDVWEEPVLQKTIFFGRKINCAATKEMNMTKFGGRHTWSTKFRPGSLAGGRKVERNFHWRDNGRSRARDTREYDNCDNSSGSCLHDSFLPPNTRFTSRLCYRMEIKSGTASVFRTQRNRLGFG